MRMSILPICMSIYYMHAWCPRKTEESIKSSETGVTDGSEPPCGGAGK